MGPSGCGKSTLLHMLGGLEPPDQGSVTIQGIDVYALQDEERSAFRRDHIGFVFQFFNLLPTLTAAENVALPLRLRNEAPGKHGAEAVPAGDRRTGGRGDGPAQPAWPPGPRPGGDLRWRAAAGGAGARARRFAVAPARRRADREPRLDERPRGDGAARRGSAVRSIRRRYWSPTTHGSRRTPTES